MPIKAINSAEPVLGYTLKERIGSGGYGEVWSAEAPGGFSKAIKFIYGYHDENRAQRELKALNRVKEVRHPFLLSLERVDIVDGQMVVISELADMSLKDRFDQCVDSGLKGIPRAELLDYLRDAADALDFLSGIHRLQHLDIKPENLLLVSGHVKVADYGLVKDIHDGTQSMMGGLTPAFAPPELFDGRPSKASDQYSLAIVFQEMLTGLRPFDGTTAAQLASQHMKERPRLSCLPREDQGIISRALSKDPELRFLNCRALIDELSNRTGSGGKPRKSTLKKSGKTSVARQATDATMKLPQGTHPLAMRPAEVRKLPPVDCHAAGAKTRPTLFLGLGHTGTYILRHLRRRLRERVGPSTATPSISLLCLDTDRRDLAAACRGETADTLDDHEAFALPLRRSEEYRADAKMHLAWLSRRWIYNVPRSLQTEGVRPLGRLALADHHERLFVRLRQVLSDIVRPEALADTAETLNMDPHENPRVYVVGSISGGTCSGMALDVAYAVRTVLQELEVADDDVIGVFAHSTGRCITDRELTVANSLAFLSELYHYSCVADFPGDQTCGLPEFEEDGTTFASTYLVHLGDDLIQRDYDTVTDSIAEYLYLSALTPCASFFDTCRTEEPEGNGLPIRTMGLSRSGHVSGDIITNSARLLCRCVLETWSGGRRDQAFDPFAFADKHLAAFRITTADLVKRIHQQILARHKDPVTALTEEMLQVYDAHDRARNLTRVREVADQFFGASGEAKRRGGSLHDVIGRARESFQEELQDTFSHDILALVDEPQFRCSAGRAAQKAVSQRLQEFQTKIEALQGNTSDRLRQHESLMMDKEPVKDPRQFLFDCAQMHVQVFTLSGVLRLLTALTPLLEKTGSDLQQVQQQLESLAAVYTPEKVDDETEVYGDEDSDGPPAKFASRMLEHLEQRLGKLVDRVDQHLQHGGFAVHGGFQRVLDSGNLLNPLLEEACQLTVVEELKEMNLDQFLTERPGVCRELVQWFNVNAQPRLLRCGGATRLLVAIPERSKASVISEEFQKQLEHVPCVLPATVGEFVTCYEVEQVPLNNVTMTLLQNQPNSIEFASRLHTRTDVAWSPLTAIR